MKKIRWTPLALVSLDKIVEYLEENWSEKEISNFLMILNSTIERLQFYPQTSASIKGQSFRRARINKQNSFEYCSDSESFRNSVIEIYLYFFRKLSGCNLLFFKKF